MFETLRQLKEKKLDNRICKKVTSMLSAYIENKLNEEERLFIENHFSICKECRKKYYEMTEIIGSLHFEYEKMLNEFNKIEENKAFKIKEYETFYNNISPYIDDELCYEDSLKFRKYLLKSKSARDELSNVYLLKNNIKKSISDFMDKSNVNFSKKIIKKLKSENKYIIPNIYKKIAVIIGFIISVLTVLFIFIGFNHFKNYANAQEIKSVNNNIYYNDENFVEFYFDERGKILLTEK